MMLHSAKTNSLPLKIGRNPKGKDRIPSIHFVQCEVLVSGVYIGTCSFFFMFEGCVIYLTLSTVDHVKMP